MARRSEIPLRGEHNLEKRAGRVCGRLSGGCAGLRHCHGGENVSRGGTPAGVRGGNWRRREFFNDSKATNVDATLKAIEAFPGPLIVILGGKDKGSPYTPLRDPLRQRGRLAILIGAAADKIAVDVAGAVPFENAGTLDRAVRLAMDQACPGDVVLLAPACSSFDQFENYEQRGRVFKELVARLENQSAAGASGRRKDKDASELAARPEDIWRHAGALLHRRGDGF